MIVLALILCSATFTFAQRIGDVNKVRLVGGNGFHEGNVQVEFDGVWGYVCDDNFGFDEADAVCRELGFEAAELYTRNNQFGRQAVESDAGEPKFWIDDLDCIRNVTVRNCSSDLIGIHDCYPGEIAGVVCRYNESACDVDEVPCLGSSDCIPRRWVCDEDKDCASASDDTPELCGDVGVTKLRESNTPINVPGIVAGTVQVKRNGVWGNVCDDGIRENDAKVICRNLGHERGWAIPLYGNYLGIDPLRSVVNEPRCSGNETWIGDCPAVSWNGGVCGSSDYDLGIICSDEPVTVRVAEGGRVEVKTQTSEWASVCATGFDDLDAQVICRMQDLTGDAQAIPATFPSGAVWNIALDCIGNETQLHHCRLRLLNDTCYSAATVRCSSERSRDALLRAALPSECGLAADSSNTYIGGLAKLRGGSPASRFSHPWIVTLRVPRDTLPFGPVLCAGIIITEDHVLTSPSCFNNNGKHSVVVRAGDFFVGHIDDGFEEEFDIDKLWIHERYKELNGNDNAIAMIKIQRKNGRGFRFTERVRPVCLPTSDSHYHNLDSCNIMGFGSTDEGRQQPNAPREADVFFVSDGECEERFGGTSSHSSTDACATGARGLENTCPGDLGSPMTCLVNARNTLYGIATGGSTCISGVRGPFKVVRVTKYIGWILEKIAGS